MDYNVNFEKLNMKIRTNFFTLVSYIFNLKVKELSQTTF